MNINDAKEVILNPKNKKQIEEVKKEESQLRVFTETMSSSELSFETYWNSLQTSLKSRSHKKYNRVSQFFRYPLPIVQLTNSVLNDYYRLYEGKNKYFNITGDRNIETLTNWISTYGLEKWIEENSKQVFKNKPNSFVVVDIDNESNPYLIYIDSSRLIDADFKNEKGELNYICFIHSCTKEKQRISFYDSEFYRVFEKDIESKEIILISEEVNKAGECPGRAFISTPENNKNVFKRRTAFSSSVSKLEDWTIFDLFRNYVDYYAPFPITESPKKKCANSECNDGKVSSEIIIDPSTDETKTVWSDCDVCKGGSEDLIFPGTHISVKVNEDPNVNTGQGIFRMIFPETDKMKYIPEKLKTLETEVKFQTTGVNNLSDNQAFNEMQVKGSFATMESVLIDAKKELDVLYKWIVSFVGKSMYKGIKLNIEVNFGTEFYLVSEEELQERFKKAKEYGIPLEEQLNIYKQLISTKYSTNQKKVERDLLLLDLDPFPLNSLSECINMKKEGIIDNFLLSLKANFLQFISKFEYENESITSFGVALEYDKRVELIKESLYLYNKDAIEQMKSREI